MRKAITWIKHRPMTALIIGTWFGVVILDFALPDTHGVHIILFGWVSMVLSYVAVRTEINKTSDNGDSHG